MLTKHQLCTPAPCLLRAGYRPDQGQAGKGWPADAGLACTCSPRIGLEVRRPGQVSGRATPFREYLMSNYLVLSLAWVTRVRLHPAYNLEICVTSLCLFLLSKNWANVKIFSMVDTWHSIYSGWNQMFSSDPHSTDFPFSVGWSNRPLELQEVNDC